MEGLCLNTATEEHHEHAVLLYNEFKDDRLATNMVKCQNTQCDSIVFVCVCVGGGGGSPPTGGFITN